MKKSSKPKIQSAAIILVLTILIAIPFSCKKMDADTNRDQKLLPYGPYVPGSLLSNMEYNIMANTHWQYQLQQSLNADGFSGYMMSATPFGGNKNNFTYAWNDGWNSYIVSKCYDDVLNPSLDIKKATKDKNVDLDLYSISLILKVMAASRLTDVFGPIPYSKLGTALRIDMDCQQEVYTAFFSELKTAVDQLTAVETSTPAADAKFAVYDKSNFGGDYKLWVQAANTLRLRLAIRISKADPSKAKSEAEAAVSHPFGLLTSKPLKITPGSNNHPISDISNSWGDISLGGPIGALLNGYKDPRIALYAKPATDPLCAGQFIGIRQGIDVTPATYYGYSRINIAPLDGIQLISSAECLFLKAEGALNGWSMGTGSAQIFYEAGVAASFTEHGLSSADATAYLADAANNKSAAYVDYHNAANNVPLGSPILSTIPKQFGGTAVEQLEEIITQKWIALFPDGQEAWSEHRRTGYPKLWPVLVNFSGGEIPMGEFVKRLPYPSNLKLSKNYPPACLSGADNGNTKLWWNK